MRAANTIMLVLLLTTGATSTPKVKVPAGCVAAEGATVSYDGYANRVIHSKTGIELVLVPAGSVTFVDHKVTLARPFYVGKTEVTNAQYKRFIEQSGYEGRSEVDPVYDRYLWHLRGKSIMPTGDKFPVVFVSWHNARAFCRWAGTLDLPTLAEWEYCCKAGARMTGWVTTNSEGQTHPVGQRKPNPWGLHDLFGNVWEWCLDDFAVEIPVPADGSARYADRSTKVLRGGAWSTVESWSGGQLNSAPVNATNDFGFRVVLRLPRDLKGA